MYKSNFLGIIHFKAWLFKHRMKQVAKVFDFLTRITFSCDIPASAQLGKNGQFPHFALGVVIHPRTVIGNNFKIYQNVTIGFRKGMGPPIIGDNCYIGSGACILGDIKIGNNVTIGANAVVMCDVPDYHVAVGIPAVVKPRMRDVKLDEPIKAILEDQEVSIQ